MTEPVKKKRGRPKGSKNKKPRVNSKRKGKRGELDACHAVQKYWCAVDCVRTAQVSGKYSADLLNALPGAHAEVKLYEQIAALRYLEQAIEDARKTDSFPLVLMRENGFTEWVVMFQIKDTEKFVRGFVENYNDEARP